MAKRMIVMIVVLLLVFGGIFGYKAFVAYKIEQVLSHRKPPPVTVSTYTVERASWTPLIRTTGSLRAVRGVALTSGVGGIVTEITFESGQSVEQGELLLALNTEVEEAQLKGQKAALKLARLTLERKKSLRERGLGSAAALDQALARYQQAKAAIASTRAVIDKKRIEAPFAGIVGIRQVDLGEFLSPGTAVATLQDLKPIYLDFELPQGAISRIEPGQTVKFRIDAYPGQTFKGRITAINPVVSESTRSFRVRATLENPEGKLRPGMFGEVTVVLNGARQLVTVPSTAIAYNPYGDFVYVVQSKDATEAGQDAGKKEGTDGEILVAVMRNVQVGDTRGDQVQIVEGLEVGERIVMIGHHKLRPGARIVIDNSNLPEVDAGASHPEHF